MNLAHVLRGKKSTGHSLVEVVIASFILVSAMVALTTVFTTHYRALNQARATLVGTNLAQKVMEECLAQGFTGVDTSGPAVTYVPPNDTVMVRAKVQDRTVETVYKIHVTVASVPVTPMPPGGSPIKDVIVTVQWVEGDLTHKVRYESLVTSGGG